MVNITKYRAADMSALVDRINKYSIGMDDYFDRLATLHETTSNYPPYNLIQVSSTESKLELALAGFSKDDIEIIVDLFLNTINGYLFNVFIFEDKKADLNYLIKLSTKIIDSIL